MSPPSLQKSDNAKQTDEWTDGQKGQDYTPLNTLVCLGYNNDHLAKLHFSLHAGEQSLSYTLYNQYNQTMWQIFLKREITC